MPIQFFPAAFNPSKQDALHYGIHLCGTAGFYAINGALFGIATPLAAALFLVGSSLSARAIHHALDKCFQPKSIANRVCCFATAFFAGSLAGAYLTTAMGLTITFASAMMLHAAALAVVVTITCLAIPCILCAGAAIGVKLLPNN
jgi:hypothetical protein